MGDQFGFNSFLGGFCFLISRFDKFIFLFLSGLFFSLSFYVYVGYKILTPLFVLVFTYFFYRKKILKKKTILIYFFVFLIFSIPLVYETVYKGAANRFSQVSIFNKAGTVMFIDEQRAFCAMQDNKILTNFCYLFWNKPIVIFTDLIKNYLASFSLDFLFLTGDDAVFINNPNHGALYFWLLPFFLAGIITIFKNWRLKNYQLFILWLLISPIMSSLVGKPNFVRSNMIFIPVTIISALAVVKVIRKKLILQVLFTLVLLINLSVLMVDYFFVYTKKAAAWDDYYSDIYKYLKIVDKDYDVIYIKKFNRHPYIYQVFYQVIDSSFFKDNVVREGFEVSAVGKYKYVEEDLKAAYFLWQKAPHLNTLYVTNEVNDSYNPILIVYSFNKVHRLSAIYDLRKTKEFFISQKKDTIVCN